jgi:hypothetical protein
MSDAERDQLLTTDAEWTAARLGGLLLQPGETALSCMCTHSIWMHLSGLAVTKAALAHWAVPQSLQDTALTKGFIRVCTVIAVFESHASAPDFRSKFGCFEAWLQLLVDVMYRKRTLLLQTEP